MALTIIHTSDLHGRLDRQGAEALGFLRERSGALLLDSGDAIGAGNIYVRPREPVLDLMNAAGYHAMAMGNREFFFRKSGLLRKTRWAAFPVLSANVLALRGDLGHVVRWTVLRSGSERVGVFGLTPTMIRPGSLPERFSDLRFIAWEGAAREAVRALRDDADWLVALSHRGMEDDLALAELCPEIDAILGGHDHARDGRQVGPGPTMISHPGDHARSAAVIRLGRGADGRNEIEARIVDLT